MKSIENLKHELNLAYEKDLIDGYENCLHKDVLLIRLKSTTSQSVIVKLKDYIKSKYQDISYVHSVIHEDGSTLYIRYIDCI
ncbi:hypothetical protein EBU94_07955 [bacterium]|nr:hypothetical protein [bacterium]